MCLTYRESREKLVQKLLAVLVSLAGVMLPVCKRTNNSNLTRPLSSQFAVIVGAFQLLASYLATAFFPDLDMAGMFGD